MDRVGTTPLTQTGLKKLRLVDLRPKLKKRGLTTRGKKEELVERLLQHMTETNYAAAETNESIDNRNMEDEGTADAPKEIQIEWCGEPIKETKVKNYYRQVIVDGCQYQLNDQCRVEASNGEFWLGKIVGMYEENKTGNKYMENIWYWTREDLIKYGFNEADLPKKISPYETFECIQRSPDVNLLGSLREKIQVVHHSQFPINSRKRDSTTYFTRFFYDVHKLQLILQSVCMYIHFFFFFFFFFKKGKKQKIDKYVFCQCLCHKFCQYPKPPKEESSSPKSKSSSPSSRESLQRRRRQKKSCTREQFG
ncbi:hypothetical protein RFI_13453 [Reticulomyxa filosa]|uniref:SAP domain-containing protein n=1 Tax=Reticulomyxa filosa TaxID=46433 RepID=X6NCV0_RETFI|nr:hypothetical protein RFI_13453 [Reticulomyxa filosa]|eukprot:ETO23723.1 hypothetical protein RFI_13453 [Reticulomyxa filosa]